MKEELLATLTIMLGWIIIPGGIGGVIEFTSVSFLGLYGIIITLFTALPLAAAIGHFSGRIASKILFTL